MVSREAILDLKAYGLFIFGMLISAILFFFVPPFNTIMEISSVGGLVVAFLFGGAFAAGLNVAVDRIFPNFIDE